MVAFTEPKAESSEPGLRVTPTGRFKVDPARPVPVRVMATVDPVPNVMGVMLVSTGTDAVSVNVTALLVPLTSVTVTLCGPRGALRALVKVAVTVPAVATMPVTWILRPALIEVTPARLVPDRVTGVAEPALADDTAMLVNPGRTVKVMELLMPHGPVTVMLCGPDRTVEAIVRVAVIEVAVTTGTVTVKPAGGLMVAPNRSVPVKVTATVPD